MYSIYYLISPRIYFQSECILRLVIVGYLSSTAVLPCDLTLRINWGLASVVGLILTVERLLVQMSLQTAAPSVAIVSPIKMKYMKCSYSWVICPCPTSPT